MATTTGQYQIDLVSTDGSTGDEVSLGFYDVTVPSAMAPLSVDRTRCQRTLIEPVTVPVGTKVVPGECPSYGSTIEVPGEVLEYPLDMVAGQSLEIVPDAGYRVAMSVIDPTGQVIAPLRVPHRRLW